MRKSLLTYFCDNKTVKYLNLKIKNHENQNDLKQFRAHSPLCDVGTATKPGKLSPLQASHQRLK